MTAGYRILVCGGCEFVDQVAAFAVLDKAHTDRPISVVISGRARGADLIGERWAISRGVPVLPFPADWNRYGGYAGPIRNKQMLIEGKPDGVIAFPGGPGTRNMIQQAKAAGVPVREPLK